MNINRMAASHSLPTILVSEDSSDFKQAPEDEVKQGIRIFCKQLFEKCSKNSPADKSNFQDESCTYVACNDVIAYIINNKLLMDHQDNGEYIQDLKFLFCDSFNLKYSNSDGLFNGCRLDYASMTNLIELWIDKIRIYQENEKTNVHPTASADHEEFEALDFSVAEFKALDEKIRSDTRMRSSNIYKPSRFELEEEYFSQGSSSKQSASNSDDDNILNSESFDNDFVQSQVLLENKLLALSSKNLELEGEIGQLKQTIADLRTQSRNAEDLNGQMAVEIEQKTLTITELRCRYNEIFSRFMSSIDENENAQKMIVHLKADMVGFEEENGFMKERIRDCQAEVKILEEINSGLNSKNLEMEMFLKELETEKKAYIEQEDITSNLKEKLKELKDLLTEKDLETTRLAKTLIQKESVIEDLTENLEILTEKLDKANLQLFQNNVYGSSKSINKTSLVEQKSRDELRCSMENLIGEIGTEDETVSSAFLVSEYNENTFHVSIDSNDFRYEQFEQALNDANADGSSLSGTERLCEHFKEFLALAEEIKIKYGSKQIADSSFNKVMTRFLEYGKSKQEMLEDLVESNKRLISRLDQTETRLKCSKYQLIAVMICLFKFKSLTNTITQPLVTKASPIKIYNEPKKTNDWLAVTTRIPQSPIKKCVLVKDLEFEKLKTSISLPFSNLTGTPKIEASTGSDEYTSSNNRIYENLNNINEESCMNHIMNSTDNSNQKMLTSTVNNVKIIDADSNCKYIKRMNSFSVLSDQKNNKNEEKFGQSISYSNDYDNEADIDEAYIPLTDTNKISAIKKFKNACRKISSKHTGDLGRRWRADMALVVKGLNSSVSVPNMMDLPDTYKTSKFNFVGTREISTQTSFDDEMNSLVSHSQLIINDESINEMSSYKKDHHLLKHQLTRDSGIDSDNTQHQQRQLSLRPSQTTSTEENNSSCTSSNNKSLFNSTITCSKSSGKGPKSLTIKSIGPTCSESKFRSSTRDNSIENDLENSLYEENNHKNNILKIVVREDEEYPEGEYIEDRYIGEEYGSDKADSSSGDEVEDKDEREFNEIRKISKQRSKTQQERLCMNMNMDESFRNIYCDPFEASRVKVDSPKPMISSTSLSKLATKIKRKNLDSTKGLSIDQVLNLVDTKSEASTSFTSTVASFWSKGRTDETTPGQHLPELNKMRSVFKASRANSISQSKSFDEHTTLTNRNLMEQRLKTLESNFNQITMAYHTDEQVLNSCIEIYRDKYRKSSVHIELLFEEISDSLGHMAVLLMESDDVSIREDDVNKNETEKNLNEPEKEIFLSQIKNSNDQQETMKKYANRSKKLLQENLGSLNKELLKLKTKVIELISTSSMITGLKQELHLTDLVKISISYVRELRNMQLLINPAESETINTSNMRTALMKRSNSITPQPIVPRLSTNRSRANSVQIESNSEPSFNKRLRWLNAMSTIKSQSAPTPNSSLTENIAFSKNEDSSLKNKTILENEEALVPNLSSESTGYTEVGRSSTANSLDLINEESNIEIKIESENCSSINNKFVSDTNECLDEFYNISSAKESDFNPHKAVNFLPSKTTAFGALKMLCNVVKEQSQMASDLLARDTFFFMRKLISFGILVAIVLFWVITVGTEIGERFLDYVFKKIEVRNYYEETRTT